MKLLSIAIPCYNSEGYMRNCIESLLPGGDEVEILIVDDGSTKDHTGDIADEYEAKYPGICRAIHQENGGHGEAVNAGLRAATGIYFKVVDSDDWVNGEAYQEVLETLRRFVMGEDTLDMLVTNFVYEKQGAKHKRVMQYRTALPRRELIGWKDVKVFILGQYILMHSVVYRTEMLRECGLELPKHTFYVDNIFVFQPLPFVKTLYYLDVNFYRYYIGRADQSVNEQIMIGRIDQQIKVTKLMLGYYREARISSHKLRHYMVRYLEIMMTIASILAIRSQSEENMTKKKELWEYLRKLDLPLYLRLRWGFLGQSMNLPGKGGRSVSIAGYKISQKFFGFN
ncbi:MAG: glycosyltransferase family 2 protein [Lachnospiraceae bacterium]|nr:glycosyltransferase family 2 protein [Lachnospiraceae bacterium]